MANAFQDLLRVGPPVLTAGPNAPMGEGSYAPAPVYQGGSLGVGPSEAVTPDWSAWSSFAKQNSFSPTNYTDSNVVSVFAQWLQKNAPDQYNALEQATYAPGSWYQQQAARLASQSGGGGFLSGLISTAKQFADPAVSPVPAFAAALGVTAGLNSLFGTAASGSSAVGSTVTDTAGSSSVTLGTESAGPANAASAASSGQVLAPVETATITPVSPAAAQSLVASGFPAASIAAPASSGSLLDVLSTGSNAAKVVSSAPSSPSVLSTLKDAAAVASTGAALAGAATKILGGGSPATPVPVAPGFASAPIGSDLGAQLWPSLANPMGLDFSPTPTVTTGQTFSTQELVMLSILAIAAVWMLWKA